MAFMPGMGPDQVPPEWQQAQPSGLGGLAQGLRLAGGVLSPQVFRTVALEQEREDQRAQQQRLLEIQQTIKGVEAGAIPPEAAQMRLRQLGFQAPVGPGPDAVARQERVQQQGKMREAMAQLPPDASFEDRLVAMAPYLEPQQQIAAFTAVEGKREQLKMREQQVQQMHEQRMQGLTNQQARDAEGARHNAAMEQMRAEGINLRRMGSALGGGGQRRAPEGFRWTDSGDLEFIPGGPRDPASKQASPKTSDSERASAGYLQRMQKSEEILSNPSLSGSVKPEILPSAARAFRMETAANAMSSVNRQQIDQAQMDWVRAKLRKESGAVIGEKEMADEITTYFPKLGDSPAVIAQKRMSRKAAEEQMRIGAGPVVGTASPASGPAHVNSDAEFNALPSGTTFIGPDGKTRRKP